MVVIYIIYIYQYLIIIYKCIYYFNNEYYLLYKPININIHLYINIDSFIMTNVPW